MYEDITLIFANAFLWLRAPSEGRQCQRSGTDAFTHPQAYTAERPIDEKFMNEPLVGVCLGLFVLLPWTATGCDAVVNLSLVNTRRRLIKQR